MRFAGYAAIFDRVDRGGDVVRRGAFSASLGKAVPLLWQHQGTPIGTIEQLSEDAKGLRVIGRAERGDLVGTGAGLSFGYRVREARVGTERELIKLDLIEVSVVRQPMQPLARVHAVEIEDLGERPLTPLAFGESPALGRDRPRRSLDPAGQDRPNAPARGEGRTGGEDDGL